MTSAQLDGPPDHETAIAPMTAGQTQKVVRLLVDQWHGGDRQETYAAGDLAWMHSRLAETLEED